MGARVRTNPKTSPSPSWKRHALAPTLLKLATALAGLMAVLAVLSLVGLAFSAFGAIQQRNSPLACVHYLQYLVESTCWYLIAKQACRISADSIAGRTPFVAGIASRINTIAKLLFALACFGMALSLAASWLAYGVLPSIGALSMGYAGFPAPETWQAIAEEQASIPIRQTLSMPPSAFALPFALLLVSKAMELGRALQEEYDETV